MILTDVMRQGQSCLYKKICDRRETLRYWVDTDYSTEIRDRYAKTAFLEMIQQGQMKIGYQLLL